MPAPKELLAERITRVQESLKEGEGVPILVTDPSNVGWLTGIPEDFQKDAKLLITIDRAHFITDGRYENRVPEIPGVETYIWGAKHMHFYPELRELKGAARSILVDTKGLSLDMYHALPAMLDVDEVRAPSHFLDRLRMIKGEREISLIREALEVAISAFRQTVESWLPEHRERATDADLRDALLGACERGGGEGVSFDPLVAMDADADTPHPDMTRAPRPLSGEHVMLIDWGITYRGVCTDLTRMVVIGRDDLPEPFVRMRALQEKWMAAVALELGPGRSAYKAGNAYLEGLREIGIEKPFHGAGHGTGGAYVHELPRVAALPEAMDDFGIPFSQSITLQPGMIVTNEPGMYERGVGGYRTENMILVTEDGVEVMDAALPMEPFFAR